MTTATPGGARPSLALVLGGGGPVGRAWQAGLATGLIRAGVELRAADYILGTSAGAIVGAQLAANLDLVPSPPPGAPAAGPGPAAAAGMAELTKAIARSLTAPKPEPIRQAIGQMALRAETPSEEMAIRRLGFASGAPWPVGFPATAVNAGTGELVVWGPQSGAPLDAAVASSCSLPGVWPPITIGSERYMDGGVRNMLNADLVEHHDAVLVVSCFPLALPLGVGTEDQILLNTKLNADIDSLRQAGATVDVVTPSPKFMALTQGGARMLDPTLAPEAFQLGAEQAAEAADQLDPAWRRH